MKIHLFKRCPLSNLNIFEQNFILFSTMMFSSNLIMVYMAPCVKKLLPFVNDNFLFIRIFLHKIVIVYLSISLNMCFGFSKEPSHWDGSFERPQHMFWLINRKKSFSCALLSGGLCIETIAVQSATSPVYLAMCI